MGLSIITEEELEDLEYGAGYLDEYWDDECNDLSKT